MSNFLESMKIDIETAEAQRIPNNFKSVDIDQAELVLKLTLFFNSSFISK